jgi:hypothetical protein
LANLFTKKKKSAEIASECHEGNKAEIGSISAVENCVSLRLILPLIIAQAPSLPVLRNCVHVCESERDGQALQNLPLTPSSLLPSSMLCV